MFNYETKIILFEKEKVIALVLTDGRAIEFNIDLENGSQYNHTEKIMILVKNH